ARRCTGPARSAAACRRTRLRPARPTPATGRERRAGASCAGAYARSGQGSSRNFAGRDPHIAPAPPLAPVMPPLLIGPFMAQADATIANVATPSIHRSLHASGAALELVIGGYLIAFAVLIITGARLGQTHGYRRVLLCGIALFSLASLLCGLAPTTG